MRLHNINRKFSTSSTDDMLAFSLLFLLHFSFTANSKDRTHLTAGEPLRAHTCTQTICVLAGDEEASKRPRHFPAQWERHKLIDWLLPALKASPFSSSPRETSHWRCRLNRQMCQQHKKEGGRSKSSVLHPARIGVNSDEPETSQKKTWRLGL